MTGSYGRAARGWSSRGSAGCWSWAWASLVLLMIAPSAGCSTSNAKRPAVDASSAADAASRKDGSTVPAAPHEAGEPQQDATRAGPDAARIPPMDPANPPDAKPVNPNPADANIPDAAVSGTPYVYVSGNAAEILIYRLDLASGAMTKVGSANGGKSPSYLAIAPNRRFLYAVNEGSGVDSVVVAFSIDANPTGALSEIDREASGGDGTPHLAIHPSGKWLAVAHYNSGHISVLPIAEDGKLGPATDIDRGPNDSARNAHQAVFDTSGKYLFVPCLGSNYVLQYRFTAGKLTYNEPATVTVAGGPRHLAFSPDERHVYVLSELESLITSFDYDAASGKLSNPQQIDSYTESAGASAHIVVHPSGKFLYVSNRKENSLGLFSIDAQGRPHRVSFVRHLIETPRDFTVDPTGAFLISANQAGAQDLLVFRIDRNTGELTQQHTVPAGNTPTFAGVVFLP